MRISLFSLTVVLSVFYGTVYTSAQTNTPLLTTNLSLGAKGSEVRALQKALNQDPATRIASAGPGSPGNETDYFGPLTRAAVIRFQEKYAGDVLSPVGLTAGSGYVGAATRVKLNALAANTGAAPVTVAATPPVTATSSSADYLVKDTEKIDIYTGDKMLGNIQERILAQINAGIESGVALRGTTPITVSPIKTTEVPSIALGIPAPRSGIHGITVIIKGTGISTNSVVYFGDTYIVRKVIKDSLGNYSFVVPPIPPARYDIAVRTGGAVSNTTPFVVADPKNPPVSITSVSPASIAYGGTLTITGSGFSPTNNAVVTTYQTITNIPSADGKTIMVQIAPLGLQLSAKVGNGKSIKPMSVYVVSDYGFSDTVKSFTMTL